MSTYICMYMNPYTTAQLEKSVLSIYLVGPRHPTQFVRPDKKVPLDAEPFFLNLEIKKIWDNI